MGRFLEVANNLWDGAYHSHMMVYINQRINDVKFFLKFCLHTPVSWDRGARRIF